MTSADTFELYERFLDVNRVDQSTFSGLDVKRGLRNADGTGVLAGVTNISNVHGYLMSDGERIPDEGSLRYRGYDLYDLLADDSPQKRFNFEEVAYLLLLGHLPTREQLDSFIAAIDAQRELPDGFTASMIMRDTPPSIMNILARTCLLLYAHDPDPESRDPRHEVRVALSLLSRLPRVMVLSHYAQRARYQGESMIMHRFREGESTAETILSMLRPDRAYEPAEARMLDVMLCLHAEHGGGNNSTFTTRVLTSADTDPYAAYSAALASLKGRRHGGANQQVCAMQDELKAAVSRWDDDDEVACYLERIVRKEAFDRTGLIYGMGHAVYTKSDPRARICRRFAQRLAQGTPFEAELRLYESIERLTPQVMSSVRGSTKAMCANVDMYSGFVYRMMGIPDSLHTPLFACARMAGWAAHRFEEIVSGRRIMRPAYKAAFSERRPYVPLDERS
ncbi:citrate synthase [Eggerthellaceae bacterium zg-997]|nr:citrate synthase [Eggerthellaceae bacterium zg-997]